MHATQSTNHRFFLIPALAALLIAMAIGRSPFARAADFTAADETELATAIAAVNAAGAGEHTIALTADITLTAPLPALNNPAATVITLDGAGHTLDAGGAGTALIIAPTTTAALHDLTVTGGAGSSGPNGKSGGGIFNQGTLTVTDATIAGNAASQGAGIFNYAGELGTANLTLVRVALRDNEASAFGGGLANTGDGGATTVAIIDSVIAGNSAATYGGGIASQGHSGTAVMTLENTTVSGNAASYGGGIFNNGNGGQASLTLTGVTLSGNTATAGGGGLFNNGNNGTATAELLNTTLSGNAAKSGGGATNSGNGGEAELSLAFTTVAENTATNGASGLHTMSGGMTTVAASILAAGSQGKACVVAGGSLTSGGYNIDTDDSCGLNATGDRPDGDPALDALALNAPGDTATHAIGPVSDAQRRVPTGTLGCGTAVAADQRGAPRPNPDTLCDVGAYESDATEGGTPAPSPSPTVTGTPPSPTPTVTGTPPTPTATVPAATATPPATPTGCAPPYTAAAEAQLQHAIDCVNAAGAGTHTITLVADILLSAAAPPLDNPTAAEIILDGDGHRIDGGRKGTVLTIAAGTVARVRDVTIIGGQGSRGPGGDWGGGIYNNGKLTVENSTLAGNLAGRGGAIANHGDGAAAELTVTRSTLSGNGATTAGGGILNSAGAGGSALLNLVNATISGNFGATGGGLFNESAGGNAGANLVYATLAQNTATTGGGGIHVTAAGGSASVTLTATIITNGAGGSADCERPSGNIVSTGYNLAGDGTCYLTQGNDLPAADARLMPLALNAPGETATHAPAIDSPALDRIHFGAAGCGSAITTDQRGAPRPMPAGEMCDAGAFERQTQQEATFVIYLPVGIDR